MLIGISISVKIEKYDEEFDFDLVNFKTTLAGNVKVSNEIFVIKGE